MKAWRWWALVLALMAARFALSLRGLDYGLPETHEPDVELVRQSLHFRGEAPAKPKQLAVYPHLVSRLMSWMPRPETPPAGARAQDLEAHLAYASRHFHAARLCVAILGALTVPLTWMLARRFLRPGWALCAAALVATSLLHFDYSQQARPHAPLATFVTAALVACVALVERPRLSRYFLAGCAAALALGALHNGAIVLLAGCAAHWLRRRDRGESPRWALAVPVLLVAAGVAAFYPFLLRGVLPGASAEAEASVADESAPDFPHRLYMPDGSGFLQLPGFCWDYDPLLWSLAAAAALHWAWKGWRTRRWVEEEQRRAVLVCASAWLPYLFVIGAYSRTFVRFLEPLVPCAAILAAWGLARLTSGLRARRPLALALPLAVLAFPTFLLVRLGSLRSAPDTLSQCASWMLELPRMRNARVLITPTLSLPLFHSVERKERYDPWSSPASHFWHRYLWDLPVESLGVHLTYLRYIAREGLPYMSVQDYPKNETRARIFLEYLKGHFAIVTSGGPLLDSVRNVVIEKGVLVQSFSPWLDGGGERPGGLDESGEGFWYHLLEARCTGPVLEVYRLGDKRK